MGASEPSPTDAAGAASAVSLRRFNRVGCVVLLLLGAVIAYVSYRRSAEWADAALDAEIKRLRAAGIIVPVESLIPVVPPGEPNAADVYQGAFEALRLTKDDDGVLFEKRGEWDPERLSLAHTVVGANEEYYRLLDEASQIEHCAFPVAWDDPVDAVFPHLAQLRQAAKMLDLRAQVMATDGNYDAALDDCALTTRLCEHVEVEPAIISALVSLHMQRMAMDSLEHLLSIGSGFPPEACRELANRLTRIDNVEHSLRGLRSEVVLLGAPMLDALQAGQLRSSLSLIEHSGTDESSQGLGVLLRMPPFIARPVLNLNLTAYLRHCERQIRAFEQPWPESYEVVHELDSELSGLPAHYPVAKMLSPVFGRGLWTRDRTTARVRVGAIALAAVAYEAERGRLPDSLTELKAAGWDLPVDPFGGGQFQYRHQGDGFVVWSIGPDMDDDGGSPDYDDIAASVGSQSPDEYDCDVVFRCER